MLIDIRLNLSGGETRVGAIVKGNEHEKTSDILSGSKGVRELGASVRVPANVKSEAIDSSSLGKLNIGRPLRNRVGGRVTDLTVC